MKGVTKNAVDRQKEIYVAGLGGSRPMVPVHFEELERRARQVMTPEAFAYVAGGAGLERTMAANRSDFDALRIVPRMLRDVTVRSLETTLFGQTLRAPLLFAPIGVLELAHPQADLGVAKAASQLGLPMVFSNQASVPMEQTAALMGDTPRWFQLYWSKSDELVQSFLDRAKSCGCSAVVVTLDTTLLGWRTRDLSLAYLPFLQGKGIAQYTSDPVFNKLLDEAEDAGERLRPPVGWETLRNVLSLMRNYPGGFWQNLKSRRPLRAVRTFIGIYSRTSLQWSDLNALRKMTDLPILLKGILHPDDAHLAVEHGVDGIIVSNHGGRQVDGSISAIAALPSVLEAVKGRVPVLLDSGVRSGSDIFKALALGAKAVLIGRPYVYGLAIAGEAGVEAVMSNLLAELELTMALAGCATIADINSDALQIC